MILDFKLSYNSFVIGGIETSFVKNLNDEN